MQKVKEAETDEEDKESSDVISLEGVADIAAAVHKLETLRVRKNQLMLERDELLLKLQMSGPRLSMTLLSNLKSLDIQIDVCKEGITTPNIDVTRC